MKPLAILAAALVALAAIALRVDVLFGWLDILRYGRAEWRQFDLTDSAGDYGVISPANSITLTYPRTEAWRYN